MDIYRLQHQPTQLVPLQQVAEAQDRRLVRCRRDAEVDAHEPAQRGGLVQRFFHPRVR